MTRTVDTAVELIDAPLLYKGKVRELYDLGDQLLIVVTDRISAFDHVLSPAVPDKGNVLNQLSVFWFDETRELQPNHMVHADVAKLGSIVKDPGLFAKRIMVTKKAKRIDIECVVRGYLTGGGWRQYQKTGEVNGIRLPEGLRKNAKLAEPLFTPAAKNDVGHDEDIPFARMAEMVGEETARALREKSIRLYEYARDVCERKGILLADCKFEFGELDGGIILIDELFTPDASRFWARENYALDIEIDSMDKEPVRTYLAQSDWDKTGAPGPLPEGVVAETSRRYREIYRRLTGRGLDE